MVYLPYFAHKQLKFKYLLIKNCVEYEKFKKIKVQIDTGVQHGIITTRIR